MHENREIAIRVENLTKSFRIPTESSNGIKQKLLNLLKGKKGYREFTALKNISFDIKKGDFFGIVGRNGSGKSTLLKSIANIYTPTEGIVQVNGSLVPFIELGVGFNPDLTGRENVFMNGALLGFSHTEMELMYDEIIDFAEIGEFMDEKLKNYSSGMQVRLAFSIAIKAKGDILLLDEVLAVGDEAFQRKCNEYFEKMRQDKNTTIILVTHSMDSVRKFCNKAILITENGIEASGSPDKVASAYSQIFINEEIAKIEKSADEPVANKKISDVELRSVYVTQANKKVKSIRFKEDFSIVMELFAESNHSNITMGLHMFDQAGRDMLAVSTKSSDPLNLHTGVNRIVLDIDNIFTDGNYHINLAIEENDTKKLLVQSHELSKFSIIGLNSTQLSKHSITHPKVEVRFE